MPLYEDRWINGAKYTVPVGTRADWKPGQPYTLDNTGTKTKPSYQEHLEWFGSPEAYAAEIRRKQQAGIPLSDPAAAQEFMRDYPQYFQATTLQQSSVQDPLVQLANIFGSRFAPLNEAVQRLNQLLSSPPQYSVPSDESLLQQARQYAALQIDPQVRYLQDYLAEVERQTEEARKRYEGYYGSMEAALRAKEEELRRQAMASMAARGLGRSGLADYAVAKALQPAEQTWATVQAEKVAQLSDVESKLAAERERVARQLQALEQQRGLLEAQQLAALRDLAYARSVGDWQRQVEALGMLANTTMQLRTLPIQLGLDIFQTVQPWLDLTPQQRVELLLKTMGYTGEMPDVGLLNATQPGFAPVGGYVPLRATLEAQGVKVDYDPATQTILINGQPVLTLSDLPQWGGYETGGTTYLPVNQMLRLISWLRSMGVMR